MPRTPLSRIYRPIDKLLEIIARIAASAMVLLVFITMYDVSTRYLGVAKFEGLNSTMTQEAQYWAHGFLLTLFIGYAYTRQTHVRIDLVRDLLPTKFKYALELFGIICLLMPAAILGALYSYDYAMRSFVDQEVSPSANGLSHFWILKSSLVAMFGLVGLAGFSQALKCIDGLLGKLEGSVTERRVLGGGH